MLIEEVDDFYISTPNPKDRAITHDGMAGSEDLQCQAGCEASQKVGYIIYNKEVPGDRVQMDVTKIRPKAYQFTAIDDRTD